MNEGGKGQGMGPATKDWRETENKGKSRSRSGEVARRKQNWICGGTFYLQ